jgi:hypothetical protein
MIQQFLLQFTGTLNRRRAYAATHPMVVSAEERLLAAVNVMLVDRRSITLSVAKDELYVDGEPYASTGMYARELATRLHRRGVGAITFEQGVVLTQISDAVAWLAAERDFLAFAPTRAGGVHITTLGYDHLVLDDSIASAATTLSALWRTLTALAEENHSHDDVSDRVGEVAGDSGSGTGASTGTAGSGIGAGTGTGIGSGNGPTDLQPGPMSTELVQALDDAVAEGSAVYVDGDLNGDLTGVDSERVIASLRASMQVPAVARRTALALSELAKSTHQISPEARELISAQLNSLLGKLGNSSFAPIINSFVDRAARNGFVNDVAQALPVGAVVNWLESAAAATEQQMSHQILRVMTKMATLASTTRESAVEAGFRAAARELVRNWDLADPNPIEHVALLDRIARVERTGAGATEAVTILGTSVVETSRIVKMALELDVAGDDTAAAADSLVGSGAGPMLMEWASVAGATRTADWLTGLATSEKAVRQLLLREPVDRLHARAMLQVLDASSTDVLLDVLELAEARGTRMIVRQRLAEFGSAIAPSLLARLEHAPWFLVRNVLTLLQEFDADVTAGASDLLFKLLEHPQVQVRSEALRILIRNDRSRRAAVRMALRDANERIVVLAIQLVAELVEGGTRPSREITAQLMALVDAGGQSDPVRARAVRVVGSSTNDEIRDWLIRLVTKRSAILRRLKLVDPTQTAATALQLLQRMYADAPAVQPVLALAARAAGPDSRWQVRDVTAERTP